MANVKALADRVVEMRKKDRQLSVPLASIRAIEASGIRDKSDVRRICRDVVSEHSRRSAEHRKAKKARALEAMGDAVGNDRSYASS